jgi:hypothetical protein
MTIKEIKSVIDEYQFSSNILFHDGKFVAFGDEPSDDFVLIGSTQTVKGSSIYKDGKKTDSDESKCSGLFKNVLDLCDDSKICFFNLKSFQVQFIQKTITAYDASHIVLYSDDDGIFVNFYDVRKCVPEGRMSRSHETRLLVHKLSSLKKKHFKMTLNSWSFKIIPSLDLEVEVGTNGICVLTHEDSGYMYLLRDQELVQPVINFFSDRLGQEISLSLVPSSNVPIQDTSPQMIPDFE